MLSRTSAPAVNRAATTGGTASVASNTTIPHEQGDRLLGAGAERHHLATHDIGRIDGEHVGIGVDVLAQRLPRPAHEQRVAGLELDAGVAEWQVVAQHAHDRELTALGHHPAVEALADQP